VTGKLTYRHPCNKTAAAAKAEQDKARLAVKSWTETGHVHIAGNIYMVYYKRLEYGTHILLKLL
jgi:hypothetical protein